LTSRDSILPLNIFCQTLVSGVFPFSLSDVFPSDQYLLYLFPRKNAILFGYYKGFKKSSQAKGEGVVWFAGRRDKKTLSFKKDRRLSDT